MHKTASTWNIDSRTNIFFTLFYGIGINSGLVSTTHLYNTSGSHHLNSHVLHIIPVISAKLPSWPICIKKYFFHHHFDVTKTFKIPHLNCLYTLLKNVIQWKWVPYPVPSLAHFINLLNWAQITALSLSMCFFSHIQTIICASLSATKNSSFGSCTSIIQMI